MYEGTVQRVVAQSIVVPAQNSVLRRCKCDNVFGVETIGAPIRSRERL